VRAPAGEVVVVVVRVQVCKPVKGCVAEGGEVGKVEVQVVGVRVCMVEEWEWMLPRLPRCVTGGWKFGWWWRWIRT